MNDILDEVLEECHTAKERQCALKHTATYQKIILRRFAELKEPVAFYDFSRSFKNRWLSNDTIRLIDHMLMVMTRRGIVQKKLRPGLEYMGDYFWNYVYYMDDLQKVAAVMLSDDQL